MPELIAATLKTWTDALNAHDAKKYASAFAADGTRRTIGEPDQVGRDAIAAGVQGIFDDVPDYRFALRRVLERGNVCLPRVATSA